MRWLLAVPLALLACPSSGEAPREATAPGPRVAWVALAGETFSLEIVADPGSRRRGLSGRPPLARNAGMLFVLPHPRPFAMVMRDCPAPIDVVFLDGEGRVVSMHAMRPEPPRGPGESTRAYESRLPIYPSGALVQFALELAGGRLAELGLAVGDRIPLDTAALAAQAR